MARNLNLFFDENGFPRARGPSSEKLLMAFLEEDVQGSDHVCRDLMDDITAIEDGSAESREFIGNAHSVVMTADGVTIEFVYDEDEDEHGDDATSENAERTLAAADSTGATDGKNSSAKPLAGKPMADPKHYQTVLKHFREVLEDWEAFILDDQTPT